MTTAIVVVAMTNVIVVEEATVGDMTVEEVVMEVGVAETCLQDMYQKYIWYVDFYNISIGLFGDFRDKQKIIPWRVSKKYNLLFSFPGYKSGGGRYDDQDRSGGRQAQVICFLIA